MAQQLYIVNHCQSLLHSWNPMHRMWPPPWWVLLWAGWGLHPHCHGSNSMNLWGKGNQLTRMGGRWRSRRRHSGGQRWRRDRQRTLQHQMKRPLTSWQPYSQVPHTTLCDQSGVTWGILGEHATVVHPVQDTEPVIQLVSPWPVELQILPILCAFYWSTCFWVSVLSCALCCHIPMLLAHPSPLSCAFAVSYALCCRFPTLWLTFLHLGLLPLYILYHFLSVSHFQPSFLGSLAPSLVFSTCIYLREPQL